MLDKEALTAVAKFAGLAFVAAVLGRTVFLEVIHRNLFPGLTRDQIERPLRRIALVSSVLGTFATVALVYVIINSPTAT